MKFMNTTHIQQERIIKSDQRGKADFGWLSSFHTFSFGNYYHPDFMGFKSLRVINDDTVSPRQGFGTHPHKNMEIISYVIEGSLAHKDSMGNIKSVHAGEFQIMSAGSGVSHSEFNPSSTEKVHFLQIWIEPNLQNTPPAYAEWKGRKKEDGLALICSSTGEEKSITIHQNAKLFFGKVHNDMTAITYEVLNQKHLYLHVINGEVKVNSISLFEGDGYQKEYASSARIKGSGEFLLFELG
jgi:quercetin 2,3-dioxygenase